MAEELKLDKKKSTWTPKKIVTTIIIVVLAFLMVFSSYLLIMYQQNHDDSNVFGYYDGEAIKYEPGTVFYNSLNGNENYMNAYMSGDWNTIWSLWSSAFQNEVVYRAAAKKSVSDGVVTSKTLVDKLIVDNGVYANEDGSVKYDQSVYDSADYSSKVATYNYMEKIYPFTVFSADIQSAVIGNGEVSFVADQSSVTRSFDYFTVDYRAISDDVASAYDISDMTKGETEPTLDEIKQYIAQKEPELASSYIKANLDKAVALAGDDFAQAAEKYGNGIVSVTGAANNVGSSVMLTNALENVDPQGVLASVYKTTDGLARELYTSEEGHITAPVSIADGGYLVARVRSVEGDSSWSGLVGALYPYYAGQIVFNDYATEVLKSDKFDNRFNEKFMELLLGSTVTSSI